MSFHGLARLPLPDNEIFVFLFGIPVKAVTKTTFFLTNSARKRTYTLSKFIRFARLDYDPHLIGMNVSLQRFEKTAHVPSVDTLFQFAKAMPCGAGAKDESN